MNFAAKSLLLLQPLVVLAIMSRCLEQKAEILYVTSGL